MSRSHSSTVRLAGYRQLYSAICTLADSLYEEALAVAADDRDAAFAASCALVARLEGERSPTARSGLLGRLEAMPRSSARSARRARLAPAT